MRNERQTRNLATRLFQQKQAWRRALAALSFPRKILLLVQLQHTASEVSSVARRNRPRPWRLNALGLSERALTQAYRRQKHESAAEVAATRASRRRTPRLDG